MAPQEKAKELFSKYWQTCNCTIAGTSTIFKDIAKQCALIAVVESIGFLKQYTGMHDQEFFDGAVEFWQSVKQEIERL